MPPSTSSGGAADPAVIANLALAWLLIEGTTAASALLVSFSGKRSALEAGWKYLVPTTLGLGVALLGIVVLTRRSAAAGRAPSVGTRSPRPPRRCPGRRPSTPSS